MSWSVSAIGKPEAVAVKLAAELSGIKYLSGVEAEIKDLIAGVIAKAVGDTVGMAVQVIANGSASTGTGTKSQSIEIEIRPIYGFVE